MLSAHVFDILKDDSSAKLIDVRTKEEWNTVGIPDLSSIAHKLHKISWRLLPDMLINPNFFSDLLQAIPDLNKENNIFVICKSGKRSAEVVESLLEKGYKNTINVEDGFEGNKDNLKGWKNSGLPFSNSNRMP